MGFGDFFSSIGDKLGNVGETIKSSPLAKKLTDGLEKSREKWNKRSDEEKAKIVDGMFNEEEQVNPYASLGDLSSNVNFNMQPLQQRQMQYYMPYERNFY